MPAPPRLQRDHGVASRHQRSARRPCVHGTDMGTNTGTNETFYVCSYPPPPPVALFSVLVPLSLSQELFIHDAAARLSNDAEKERLEQVRRSLDRLDTALLRLDENLMFFNTF